MLFNMVFMKLFKAIFKDPADHQHLEKMSARKGNCPRWLTELKMHHNHVAELYDDVFECAFVLHPRTCSLNLGGH